MHFNIAFDKADSILNGWTEQSSKLLKLLLNGNNIKSKHIKTTLEQLKTEAIISDDSKNLVILWAIHSFLVPSHKIVKKYNGKDVSTKFTISYSQDSFLFIGKNAQEIEEHIHSLKVFNQTSIQPFVYCTGSSISEIKEYYVYFDNVRFKFASFLRAVDICFKIFYLFNLQFPAQSVMFWTFLEKHFFKLNSDKDFSKCHILSEYLNVS